jgi:hypothetical protein
MEREEMDGGIGLDVGDQMLFFLPGVPPEGSVEAAQLSKAAAQVSKGFIFSMVHPPFALVMHPSISRLRVPGCRTYQLHKTLNNPRAAYPKYCRSA